MAGFAAWHADSARALVAPMAALPGAALPMLHALQERFGYIDPAAVPLIADAVNVSRAEIHGLVSFYHDFRSRPPAARVIRLCRAEACQAAGCEALVAHAAGALGLAIDSATEPVAIETVYCLGNCALGPAAMVDGDIFGRLDEAGLTALCAEVPAARAQFATPRAMAGVRIYVPIDAAALSVGAEAVAVAIAREADIRGVAIAIIRPGTRGMLWLEPMVEVQTARGRVAYGPVTAADVAGLFDAGFTEGRAHKLLLGATEELPWLRGQQRLSFARVGVIDPVSLDAYRAAGGLLGLAAALAMEPATIVAQIRASGLRGRGGAGFPTGIKWQTVLDATADQKYIVCNADEGDSGTFADRMLIEGDPFSLIEGMVIAGLAVGANQGFIYLRSEYPHAWRTLQRAVGVARAQGLLGRSVLGSGRAFDIALRLGAGAYICGEETALLESLEGRRGVVRAKPPLPALHGLFGKPTVVNNVLSLAAAPWIMAHGADAYAGFGMGRSRGTIAVQLGGNIRRGGLVELAFGMTLRALIEDFGGGTRTGRPVRAVQVGGPLGAFLPVHLLDTKLDYEALAGVQGMLGHGGVVVFDDSVDMAGQARFAFEFCAKESCGKCTPCRIGAVRGMETVERIVAGIDRDKHLAVLDDLTTLMTDASLCAMGGLTPLPVQSALRHFPEDFRRAAIPPAPATHQTTP